MTVMLSCTQWEHTGGVLRGMTRLIRFSRASRVVDMTVICIEYIHSPIEQTLRSSCNVICHSKPQANLYSATLNISTLGSNGLWNLSVFHYTEYFHRRVKRTLMSSCDVICHFTQEAGHDGTLFSASLKANVW